MVEQLALLIRNWVHILGSQPDILNVVSFVFWGSHVSFNTKFCLFCNLLKYWWKRQLSILKNMC